MSDPVSPVSSQTSPSSPSIGWVAGISICLIVSLCLGLGGLSVYIKYQLDRSESLLASPEFSLSLEQQGFDKIRNALGFGGFLGFAQNFSTTHDATILPEAKEAFKQATSSFERLPTSANAATRHDLEAILAIFQASLLKAEKSTAAGSPTYTSSDLMPLYAALPALDARVNSAIAADRQVQHEQTHLWATYLTLICWSSLVVAAILTVTIFIVLRGRNSAPMHALAQSVKNMARGDMRAPIWGMERQDTVGELARAVDMARFYFSQLPDMSVMSEQGPVRMRFEGNTRSLFEAMMRVISKDSEQVHAQTENLTEAVQKQQEALAHVVDRVEAILSSVENRAVTGDQQVRQALHGMLGSAESLKHAQEHAADQLNRIIPFLQERTQGISEITQITGKQVAQALQSLLLTERGLKNSAEQSEAAVHKLSSSADALGERLFGAVNLLQASGKVLAETTATAKNSFATAIERINIAAPALEAGAALDTEAKEKLSMAATALEAAHGRLEVLLSEQSQTTRAHIDLLSTQSSGLLTQASTSSQTLSTAADRMRDEQKRLSELIQKITVLPQPEMTSTVVDNTVALTPVLANIRDGFAVFEQRLTVLQGQIAVLLTASERIEPAPALGFQDKSAPILDNLKDGFAALEQRMTFLQSQLAALLAASKQPEKEPVDYVEQMRDHWFQMAAQIEATRSNLAQIIMHQTDRVEAQIGHLNKPIPDAVVDRSLSRDTQNQMEQQTLILNELVATLGLLDAHMQELRSQVSASRQKTG